MSSYKPSYKPSGTPRSSKLIQKRQKRFITILFLSALCVVTLLASSILILRSSLFQVTTIEIKGPADLPIEAIKENATRLLALAADERTLFIFPKNNRFFVSKKELEKQLSDDFKEINTISITSKGFHTLVLSIQARIPVAIVCFGFLDDNSTAADGNNKAPNCYYSDKHAYIYASLSSSTSVTALTPVSPTLSLPSFDTLDSYNYYYVPTDKGTSPLGTTFIDEARLSSLEKFINDAHAGGLSPLGVLIGDNGEYEMYIKNKKEDSEVTVYFDEKKPFDATLSNLLTFWNNPLSPNIKTAKKATTTTGFDYINLRFGNTVYYAAH